VRGRRCGGLHAQVAQQVDRRHQRQSVERFEGNAGVALELGQLDARRDQAEAGVVIGKQAQ